MVSESMKLSWLDMVLIREPWVPGPVTVPVEGMLVWHLCGSLCATTLPARGFSVIVVVTVLHQKGNEGGSCQEKKGACASQRVMETSFALDQLWGGRECAEWSMCNINRRLRSWEVCDLDFSGFPAYSQRSYPFSLSSSASIATKSILTPHKWLEQESLPLRVSTAGWKTEVFDLGRAGGNPCLRSPWNFQFLCEIILSTIFM